MVIVLVIVIALTAFYIGFIAGLVVSGTNKKSFDRMMELERKRRNAKIYHIDEFRP